MENLENSASLVIMKCEALKRDKTTESIQREARQLLALFIRWITVTMNLLRVHIVYGLDTILSSPTDCGQHTNILITYPAQPNRYARFWRHGKSSYYK